MKTQFLSALSRTMLAERLVLDDDGDGITSCSCSSCRLCLAQDTSQGLSALAEPETCTCSTFRLFCR
jgi:hypothetical protein